MHTSILKDFITIFLGITVEALPFVVLGVIVSVLVELFLTPETVVKIVPKNRFLSHPVIALTGIFMPVCEYGNVPVARRLMLNGFSVSQTITFLLAAPIINPITLISTLEAFNFDKNVALFRLSGAFFIAVGIGILLSYVKNQKSLLTPGFSEEVDACMHEHVEKDMVGRGLQTFHTEFLGVTKLLLFGALIAAATQTIIPRSIIEDIGQSPFLSVIAMLILAFIVSICANIDAFFALAYVNSFPIGALVTFMLFGPMIDIRILSMLKNTFSKQLLLIITILVAQCSILIGVLINYFY